MAGKHSDYGLSFTATNKGIARSLMSPVEVESAVNPNGKIKINALWDTGASGSLIRPEVARQLNLPCVAKTLISTPSGKGIPSNVYLVHLYLPNRARIVGVHVIEGIPNNCEMLVGMDVITMGDFAVSNYNGRTMFSFRMPSMTEIDFCKHSYLMPKVNDRKIGRNDLCPCGSGKKYKMCCGR